MSSRESVPLGSAVLPVYNALGGPQGNGHVTFDRTQSQYLDAGPRTLNIATNGGLTIVAVVRFTGTPGVWERIIDMSSDGREKNYICMGRWDSSTHLMFHYGNGDVLILHDYSCQNVIEQNTWMTIVVRYRAYSREYVVKVTKDAGSSCEITGTATAAMTDRQLSSTLMGKNPWEGQSQFNGDMAGVFVVDEYLTTDATSAIADSMARGEDLTTQGPCAPQVLSPLLPVALSSADLCPILIVARSLCLAAALAVISLSCCEVHECPC
jgi:hypothetical protein